jgi:hypothetical protein
MLQHIKAFWGLCWRMMLFAPIGLLGSVAFVVVLGLTFFLPIYALFALVDGQYLFSALSLVIWLVWLRYGGPARHFVFEGFEHGL